MGMHPIINDHVYIRESEDDPNLRYRFGKLLNITKTNYIINLVNLNNTQTKAKKFPRKPGNRIMCVHSLDRLVTNLRPRLPSDLMTTIVEQNKTRNKERAAAAGYTGRRRLLSNNATR